MPRPASARGAGELPRGQTAADRDPPPPHSLPTPRGHLVARSLGCGPLPPAPGGGPRGPGDRSGPRLPRPGAGSREQGKRRPLPSPPAGAELGSQAGPSSPPAPGSAAPPPPPPPRGVTRPVANRGRRGGGEVGRVPGRSRAAPYPTGSGLLLPKTSALIVLGMSEVEKGTEGASERLEDRGPRRRIGVPGELPLPPAPKPITFPNLSWVLFCAPPRARDPGAGELGAKER